MRDLKLNIGKLYEGSRLEGEKISQVEGQIQTVIRTKQISGQCCPEATQEGLGWGVLISKTKTSN